MRHVIVDSINKIKKEEWDSVFGDIPEGHSFYKTLEESNLKEFIFYYILLYQHEDILAIAPMFIAPFSLDTTINGFLKKMIRSTRKAIPNFFTIETLFCGSPFGENGILGIKENLNTKRLVTYELSKIIKEFCRQEKISFIVFKDFLKEDSAILDSLVHDGYFKVRSLPSVMQRVDYNSLGEYFKTLGYSTRKNLRRKIRNAYLKAKIEIKTVEEIEDVIDDIYKLYLNAYNAGDVKFEKLTKEFFINITKNLKPHAKHILYYVNGRLSAFNLCFEYDNLFIDKFIGFDNDLSRKHNLYFVSWCHNIERCIKNRIPYYQTGQTDYEPKLRLGGKEVPLYAYAKHTNPTVNFLLKLLAGMVNIKEPHHVPHISNQSPKLVPKALADSIRG